MDLGYLVGRFEIQFLILQSNCNNLVFAVE